MKKTKMIAMLAALAILAAMTGIAAANPARVDIAADQFSIGGGNVDTSTVTTDLIAYAILGDHTRYVAAVSSSPNVYVRVHDQGSAPYTHDTGWSNDQDPSTTTHSFTYSATEPNTYTWTIEVKGTENGIVYVSDNAGTSYSSDPATDDADAESRMALIPEFATIAIPAVAILGLFLFFNHRKRKEE